MIAGVMASGSLWLLSGWDPVDRGETIGRWWRCCARTAAGAQGVVDRVLASFRARMGSLGRAGAAVGSGEVADMIDIVGLGLSAGLSFDAALSLYCDGFRARMGSLGRAGAAVGSGEVADMIDIVGLGLSAGLSFDAALSLYCDGRPGVLAGRLERALLSWQSGIASRASPGNRESPRARRSSVRRPGTWARGRSRCSRPPFRRRLSLGRPWRRLLLPKVSRSARSTARRWSGRSSERPSSS